MKITQNQITRLAEEIVRVLPAASIVRVCSDERETVRYAVRSSELKLRTIVFGRLSLQRLLVDPACPVKVEYLQRELLEAAPHRGEFRYPRIIRRATAATIERITPPPLAPRASAS